ncbi:hypothetical protein [Rhodococcus wratislaviensis]|uniref:Uncharacterized protein n=1 Tax=Rhodococcus wratislaviensis NBRC 100605 TaxID=1219028 RepID=X0Q0Q5_RHOWR|nr:hypothetical protein [Rhodococcus wratislaviensis]GAF43746.1 hypothetical protein RW1_009_01710 [Rhodococcus wratislaviensis NBRC 100605]
MRTANPITTAIRSWVLRSPGRLASGIAIMVAVLYLARLMVTAVTGAENSGSDVRAHDADTSNTSVTSTPAAAEEVTETAVATMSASSIGRSPATAAMYYANAFVDTTASPTQWAVALSRVTRPERVNDTLAAARPTAPVSILGPTRTLPGTGTTGTTVEIDTSAGTMTVAVTDTNDGWQVTSPLPTLDLDDVAAAAPTTGRTTTTATTTPSPVTAPSPQRIPESPSSSEPAPPAQQVTSPAPIPVPVPGPIPIPELDTPLPGPIA